MRGEPQSRLAIAMVRTRFASSELRKGEISSLLDNGAGQSTEGLGCERFIEVAGCRRRQAENRVARTPLQGSTRRTTTVKKVARGDGPQLGGARAGIDIPRCSSTPAASLGSVTKATSLHPPVAHLTAQHVDKTGALEQLGPAEVPLARRRRGEGGKIQVLHRGHRGMKSPRGGSSGIVALR
jgi:hypothetical protein